MLGARGRKTVHETGWESIARGLTWSEKSSGDLRSNRGRTQKLQKQPRQTGILRLRKIQYENTPGNKKKEVRTGEGTRMGRWALTRFLDY